MFHQGVGAYGHINTDHTSLRRLLLPGTERRAWLGTPPPQKQKQKQPTNQTGRKTKMT